MEKQNETRKEYQEENKIKDNEKEGREINM